MPRPNSEFYNHNKWCIMLGIPNKISRDESFTSEMIMKEFEEDCIGEKRFHHAKGFNFYVISMDEKSTGCVPIRGLGDDKISMRSYTIVIENTNEPYVGTTSLDNAIRVLYDHDDIHCICRDVSQKVQTFCDTSYGEKYYPKIKYIYYFDRRFKDKNGLPHLYSIYMEHLGFVGDVANFQEFEGIVNNFDDESNNVIALEYYDKFSRDCDISDPKKFYVELYNTVLLCGALNMCACAAEESNIAIIADNLSKVTPNLWAYRFKDERSFCEGITWESLEYNKFNASNVSAFFASCSGECTGEEEE